ncbi:pre-mRNA-splicing factor CWC25 homolog [Neocloeon triangulifer]|uniref:pre-mRNA-splicing factor CWC25 homolog n=1 Tax=Neocloeon triangulifer TaxID=2078957 RepID=UPI00286EC24C|nr:pre-mRNA-splicing factor CWC25 homolog [Neocloeon triangulifer]XP_059485563.1 pre-mRNA-splicing factor CWC25 homolog [Neocloeon triangulifer]
MGGGDLNLKKSWHPNTMKNMEKVWKAEQRQEAEQKKIRELQRELQEERNREEITSYAEMQGVIDKKDGSKLDWMYKGPGGKVDREQYLLGKTIDKPLEEQLKTEKVSSTSVVDSTSRMHPEYDGIPTNILKTFGSGSGHVDVARKIMEDPLSAIRKKEVETRTELLSNPVRMKQLKELLEKQKSGKKHKKHKKEKKNKKSKYNDDEDLDKLLAAKYSKLKHVMEQKDLKKILEEEAKSKKANAKRSRSRSESVSSDEDRPKKKAFGLVLPAGYSKKESARRERSRSPPKKKPDPLPQKYRREAPKKLSEEEKAARLREMQANAGWRDSERTKNVKRYRAEDTFEKEHHKEKYDSSFINKQLAKAAERGTVEERIRSNKNYIQRGSGSMDKNFARR